MGSSQQFSLRWNNYLSHITGAFDSLRSDEDLVDVTLSCEGKRIRAHKMLLSACSTYFRDLFKENPCQHPVIIFRNVKFEDLVALVDFMYQGEVNVVQEQLASFLTTAELLAVQGLSEGSGKDSNSDNREEETADSPALPPEPEVQMTSSAQSHNESTSSSRADSPRPFYSTDRRAESPPSAKRRKWSSGSAASKSISNGSAVKDSDRDTENDRRHSRLSNTEPAEVIPIVPNLKMEIPEYLDHDPETSSCSYSESNQGVSSVSAGPNSSRDGMTSLTHNLPCGSSLPSGKVEPPDVYSTNSRDSSLPPSTDSIAAPDLGQVLAKPGPSGENQSQDSLQALDESASGEAQPREPALAGEAAAAEPPLPGMRGELKEVKDSLCDILHELVVRIVKVDKKMTTMTSAMEEIKQLLLNQTEVLSKPNGLPSLPMQSYSDCLRVEQMTENDTSIKDYITKKISLASRGASIKECTRRVMEQLMSNHAGTFYNWEGRNGKRAFSKCQFCDPVKLAVKNITGSTDMQEVEAGVKEWLKSRKFVKNQRKVAPEGE